MQYEKFSLHHALICTCTDIKAENTSDEQHAYVDLFHFWDIIIIPEPQDDQSDGQTALNRKEYYAVLHDEFLLAFIRLIKAFNLEITIISDLEHDECQPDTGVLTSVASHSLKPVNQKDFVLFQNLVEFWCALLPRLKTDRIQNWIHIAGSSLIAPSLRLPLVSGFYKMLSALLMVADKLGIFYGHKRLDGQPILRSNREVLSETSATQVNSRATFILFRDYLKEVWHRAQQFKDELLASCLRLMLASPLCFFDIPELVPPIQTALHLGISYHPLAWVALDALELLLNEDASVSINEPFLANVLPHMNEYLTLEKKVKKDSEDTQRQYKLPTTTERRYADLHKKKIDKSLSVTQNESFSLHDIQVRMLRILARLGGSNKMMLRTDALTAKSTPNGTGLVAYHQNSDTRNDITLAWDPERRLQVKIPFPNAEIEITLDEMLPRICELAESSPDRQVKVAACELLHALVLVMIGNSAFQAKDRLEAVKSRYHKLYLRIFPILLRLATDIDQVARDMFKLLISQLIHWLTNNAHYENPETIALLQTCIDASCSTNAGLRDYGADCIQEFTKWSIKQTKAQESEGPLNVKSLLKRIYNLASHSNPTKRLGASIIFNRIYRIFREEDALVDEFTLELLQKLFLSLRLAENDHPSIGTREQTKAAISHIKRILRVKISIFQSETRLRRPFPGLERSDLPTVVEWAFRETGQLQRGYAKACMEFFGEFVLGLPGIRNANEWLLKQQAKNGHILTDTYETQKLDHSTLKREPSVALYQQWLLQLICALDGYVWMLERGIIEADQVIHQESSILFSALVFFVQKDPSKLLGQSLNESILERAQIFSLHSYASFRIISLLNQLMNSQKAQDTLSFMENCGLLLDGSFSSLISRMLVFPSKIVESSQASQGTISTLLNTEKVVELMKHFLRIMADVSPPRFLRSLANSVGTTLDEANIDLENLVLNEGSVGDISQAIDGVRVLQSLHLLDMLCSENCKRKRNNAAMSGDEYCQKLFDKFIEFHSTHEPSWINILGNMIKIAFNQPLFARSHGSWLLGLSGSMESMGYVEKLTVYQKYSDYINSCIAINFKDFMPMILSNLKDAFVRDVVLGVVGYLAISKVTRKAEITSFMNEIAESLKDTVDIQFPSSSVDLKIGTDAYNDYITALDRLLNIMATLHSVLIFKILIPTFIQESNHIHADAIRQSIAKFSQGLGLSSFEQVSQNCFAYFKDETLSMGQRQNSVELVVSMLPLVQDNHVIAFYKANIVYIMSIIKREFIRRGTDGEVLDDLNEKIPESEISSAWEEAQKTPGQGRKMTIDLVGMANKAKNKKNPPEADKIAKTRLLCQQVAYNAAAAAILRTQKSEKFYVGFLFMEKPNEPLWENIVDLRQEVHLVTELSQPLMTKRLETLQTGYTSKARTFSRRTYYMSSVDLSGSSLSQASLSELALENRDKSPGLDSDSEGSLEPPQEIPDTESTMFEIDQFNENPCMKMLITVVQKLHKEVANGEPSNRIPLWMSEIFKAYTAPDSPIMLRLFLAKLIINCSEAFENYAEHWIRPLIKLATAGMKYGEPMNYFVQDLCVLVITWGQNVQLHDSYDDKYLLFEYLTYLMRHAYHENTSVLKCNIQFIKGVFDNWKRLIIVPTKTMYDQFSNPDKQVKRNQVGLQLVGLVLAHDINPYYDGPEIDLQGVDELKFISVLLENINNKHRAVYADASEVAAWLLDYKKKIGSASTDMLQEMVMKKLLNFNPTKDSADTIIFLVCLHRMRLHDTTLCERFATKVVYMFPRLYNDAKVMALEIITSCSNVIEDIFATLQKKGLLDMLRHRNVRAQLASLSLLEKIADTLSPEQIETSLQPLVSAFPGHSSTECRKIYYSILKRVYDKPLDNLELQHRIKTELLRGLIDDNEMVRKDVTTYWESRYGMTTNVSERLSFIMKNMYAPEVENLYIRYSTQMLFYAAKESYEYDKELFATPLPNARFDSNYQRINTLWQKNMSMVPLFVATQEPTTVDPNEVELQLRETQQSLLFSQTQSGAGSSTLLSAFGSIQGTSTEPQDSSTAPMEGLDYASSEGQPSQNVQPTSEKTYGRLRRRFVKTSHQGSANYFSRRNETLQKRLQKYQVLQKEAREKKVTMYRNYRVGELPDIQIKHRELIEPLQALGRKDNEIARLLHAGLVVSIVNDVETNHRKDNYKRDILAILQKNLGRSSQNFPPAIGSFLRICFELGGTNMTSSLIRTVSEKSLSQHIGIALLEQDMDGKSTGEPVLKKSRLSDSKKLHPNKKKWVDLAMLYRSATEPEIFQTIYQTKIATSELPKKAIDAEIRGDYETALDWIITSFDDLAEETSDEEVIPNHDKLRIIDMWLLTQWESITSSVDVEVEHNYESLWNPEIRDPYMRYFLRSFVKLREGYVTEQGEYVPWVQEEPNPIFQFILDASQTSSKMEYLVHHFPCELSLASIYQGDYDHARYYIRTAFDSFLSDWTSLQPLSYGSRLSKLTELQKIVELEDFLNVTAKVQRNGIDVFTLQKYVYSLQHRYPDDKLDSMDVWDDIVDSRMIFMDILDSLTQNSEFSPSIEGEIKYGRKGFLMKMATAARRQNNFTVAISRFKQLHTLGLGTAELAHELMHLDLQVASFTNDNDIRIKRTAQALGRALSLTVPEDPSKDSFAEYHFMVAKACEIARTELQTTHSAYQDLVNSEYIQKLSDRSYMTDATAFANHINKNGYQTLSEACEKSVVETEVYSTCLWNLGEYCDNALRSQDDPSIAFSLDLDVNQYSRTVIDCYFKAMAFGEKRAIERFPRLLELIELYPEAGQCFKANAETFDTVWMYIRWIPQLVAMLGSENAVNIFPALYKLASTYPNAVYYPFHISNEHFEAIKDKLSTSSQEQILLIKNTVRTPLMEDFTNELRRLTNPEHTVKDFIESVQSICQHGNVSKASIESLFRQFSELLLNPNSKRMGTIPKAFAVRHASQLRELFGKDGSKLLNISRKDLGRIVKYYQTSIQNQKLPGAAELLKSYSPWLAEFHGANYDVGLEIPGQYHGLSQPFPEEHAKIVGFDERLLVMSSLRKPKRLQLYGTDGKEHLFLVKGGEDLRLDQRIQQLFMVMNEMIHKNAFCAQQNIFLKTYKVIPMATNVGIIEWVDNTRPLRSCIEEQMKNKVQLSRVQESYRAMVSKYKGDTMGYHNLFKAPRDKAEREFNQISMSIRSDFLHQFLVKLAASPESFLLLRREFANSLAAISVAGYLLGIGDRHLENFLLDLKSGRLIAIDFGHAFGSATELLPVPELVPFRLTRQLIGALEPLGVPSLLEVPMTNVLHAIQSDKELVLNTMNVFIKEPLLDWKKVAMKQAHNQKRVDDSNVSSASSKHLSPSASPSSSMEEELAWYPQKKLEVAKSKLERHNPAHVVNMELVRGHQGKPYLESLMKMARGDPTTNIRAKVGPICRDSHEQVQCLIDLATDPSVLGRMWIGWQSYL
ncbi:hypothetical protein DFQ29_000972 [Apophysomyces sp. BC1021]|nr:hypothetical protein DFQ29_000972 [Apophysomyces sp. BC1021]